MTPSESFRTDTQVIFVQCETQSIIFILLLTCLPFYLLLLFIDRTEKKRTLALRTFFLVFFLMYIRQYQKAREQEEKKEIKVKK
jgi:hypothetical protein